MERKPLLLLSLLVVLPGLGLVGLVLHAIATESELLRAQEQTRRERLAQRLAREVRGDIRREAQQHDRRLREVVRRQGDLAAVSSAVLIVEEDLSVVVPPSPFAEGGPAEPPAALREVLRAEAERPAAALTQLGDRRTPYAQNVRARLLVRLRQPAEALQVDARLLADPAGQARLRRVALQRRAACLEQLGRPDAAKQERAKLTQLLLESGGRGDSPEAVWAALRGSSDPRAAVRDLATRARIAAVLRAVHDAAAAPESLDGWGLIPDAAGGWLVIGPTVPTGERSLRIVYPVASRDLRARVAREAEGEDYPARVGPATERDVAAALGLGLQVAVGSPVLGSPADAIARFRLQVLIGLLLAVAIGGVMTWRSMKKTAELARLRADFVASVTHELRTPLASIRSLADVLALGKVEDPAERAEFLDGIAAEARRLSRLVDDILDVARIERGAFTAELEPGRVEEVIEAAVEALRPLAAQEGYALELEPLPELPSVLLDRVLLARALENLVTNAIKYSGGERRVIVGAGAADGAVTITVADAGGGIPAGERERVFERFVRGRATDGKTGAGLGLAIVREIMTAHQGSASLTCPPEGGCRFTLRLPVWEDRDR